MFNFLYKNFLQTFQLFFLIVGLSGKNYHNFRDLYFKQTDFINYKIFTHNVVKDNFIKNMIVKIFIIIKKKDFIIV